ncbi:MAG: putative Alkanesulfonate monooxygenase (FMNH2-dependent aliphatic sulfonate monooxygenase 1) [Acidimicrobiales bacterium]|nr:putative Alkanesulfonate monooxygenase (FMNH2-dependent aliphatic sulfonate monooxygenase 1) [Acidimicrobiales bacterium]
MQLMLQYPDLHGPDHDLLDAGSVPEIAAAAERFGWDGLSFTEHPAPGANWLSVGGHQTLDPFVALGAAAAVTQRLRLLTYLAVVPYRNPLLLAKAATTVDRMSNGRFTLGVGTGYLKAEFFALGTDFEERNELFDEALDVLPMHWSGERFSYAGKHFNARDVLALPRPVQDPIPIWIGGNSALTLRRVAAGAQGWMPLLGPPEMATTTRTPFIDSLAGVADRVRKLRDLAGDRAAAIDIAVPYLVDSITSVDADAERHRDQLGQIHELGASWTIVAGPWAPAPAALEFIEAFAGLFDERGAP